LRAVFRSRIHRAQRPAASREPLRFLGEQLAPDTVVTTDVGQHQMWVAASVSGAAARTLLTSADSARWASACRRPSEPRLPRGTTCRLRERRRLEPDNIQELATLAELDLPVAIVLFNNAHLGLVQSATGIVLSRALLPHRASTRSRISRRSPCVRTARGVRIDALGGDPLAEIAAALAVSAVPDRRAVHEVTNGWPCAAGAANHQTITAQPEPAMSDFENHNAHTDTPCSNCGVRNHPGAMSHICGLFARRAFNLEAIVCVSNVDDAGATRTMLASLRKTRRGSIRSNDSLQSCTTCSHCGIALIWAASFFGRFIVNERFSAIDETAPAAINAPTERGFKSRFAEKERGEHEHEHHAELSIARPSTRRPSCSARK